MPATTTLLGLVTPTQGTLSGTWGDTVNYGISDYVDIAVAGTLTLTNDGAVTLANTTGSSSGSSITSSLTGAGTVTAQFAIVKVTGTLTVAKVVTGPSYSKTYTVVNSATGGIVTFKASGQTGVSIAVGETAFVYFNGTDYVKIVGTATAGAAGGSTTQVQFNSSGILSGSSSLTWDGTTLSSTQVNITGQGTLRLQDTTGGEYVGLRSPSALGASYTLTFPADDGTSGQALITDGSGVLSWSTAASGDVYGPGSSTDNAVARFDSTTGKLLQNSVVLIGDTGAVTGVTDLTASGSVTLSGGTANGVAYLNGSKVVTSGSALTFDGTNLTVSAEVYRTSATSFLRLSGGDGAGSGANVIAFGQTHASAAGRLSLSAVGTGDIISNTISGTHIYQINSTEQMRLTSTGLGIGTSSPSVKLDVVGASAGATVSQFTSNETGTTTSLAVFQRSGGAVAAAIKYNATNSPLTIDFGTTTSHALTFLTANTEQMRLDTSGNLGIGTSSPAVKLDVIGAVKATIASTASNSIRVGNSGSNFYFATENSAGGSFCIGSLAYSGLLVSDNAIQLSTTNGGSVQATLNTSGNLGLGVTPSAWGSGRTAFDIGALGYVTSSDLMFVGANVYYNGSAFIYKSSTSASGYQQYLGAHAWYNAASGTAGNAITFTQAMTLDAAGRLLIGQTVDKTQEVVRISGSGQASLLLDNTGKTNGSFVGVFNDAALFGVNRNPSTGVFYNTSNYAAEIIAAGSSSTSYIAFGTSAAANTAPTERARIDSSGNLLVGTTSQGTIGTNSGVGVYNAGYIGVSSTGDSVFARRSSDGDVITFRRDTTSVGSIAVTTLLTTYNTTSDYRLKTVIGPVANSGQRIDALEPIEYTWNESGTSTRGFLAHEFQTVYPNSVTGDKDAVDANGNPKYQAMQAGTAEVIADLVAEIQSLRVRLAVLEAK